MKKITNLISLFTVSSLIFIIFIILIKKYYAPVNILFLIVIFLSIIVLIISIILKKINILFGIIFFIILITILYFRIIFINNLYDNSIKAINDSSEIIGYIDDFPAKKDNELSLKIKVIGIKQKNITDFIKVKPFLILAKIKNYQTDFNRGDVLCINKPVKLPKSNFNKNYSDYLFCNNIYGLISVKDQDVIKTDKIKLLPQINLYKQTIWRLRDLILKRIKSNLSEKSFGFLISIFFGIRSELDKNIYDQFINTGLVHLLAISGLNIGGIGILFFKIFNFFLSKSKSYLLTDIILFIVVSMILQSASCDRAFYMYLIASVFFITGCNVTIFNVLAFTNIVMMLFNPYCIFDIGFQFSFMATAGIILLKNNFDEKLPLNMPENIKSAISVTLSSFLSVVILQIAIFHKVQLFSIISSIIIVPLFTLFFYLLLFAIIFICFFNFYPVNQIVEISITGFLKLIEILNLIPPVKIFNVPPFLGYLILPALIIYFYLIEPAISKYSKKTKIKKILNKTQLKKAA